MSSAQVFGPGTLTSPSAHDFSTSLRYWPAALVLIAALLLTAFAYRPGTGGSLHFDDPHNLDGLRNVVDLASAVDYVTSGSAGPTGRPLALASFAPQAYAWPLSPEVFLHTNICLHLLNGVLVVWMVYLLCLGRREDGQRAAWVAALSGATWMLSPMLASSSLFIVQRMTLLSSTFVLLGLIGYLYSRRSMARRPFLSLASMSVSLGIGTGLAVLAKENGALLPLFVLVTELTLLGPPADGALRKLWRTWFAVFLAVPAVLLAGYLLLQVRYDDQVVLMRGFSGPDRLLTEASVLWEYLFRAFVPSVSWLGPFHDDQALHRDWLAPSSLLAVAAWAATVTFAVALRRRAPWFSFAVGWYLVGHALESTTIALELYFEHRNYLPLIGPMVALAAVATNVAPQWRALAKGALLAYSGLFGMILFSATSLWGDPPLAADMWARYHPESLRATMYLSGELQKAGFYQAAREITGGYADRHPTSGTARLHVLDLSCALEPEVSQPEQVEFLKRLLRDSAFEYGVFDALQHMREHVRAGACDAVITGETVYALASVVEGNPVFRSNGLMRHNLHVLMAEEAFEMHDLDRTMKHLESALDAYYTVTTVAFAVGTLNSAGLPADAARFVQDAYSHTPKNALQAAAWKIQLATLERSTLAAAQHE